MPGPWRYAAHNSKQKIGDFTSHFAAARPAAKIIPINPIINDAFPLVVFSSNQSAEKLSDFPNGKSPKHSFPGVFPPDSPFAAGKTAKNPGRFVNPYKNQRGILVDIIKEKKAQSL